ncbi:MAG: hypothetical protein COU46_03585 [Candidatus Niyogibacteria bacterium CG10_big_fil_rev_8_21_14_0_10_42_19]|uniref:Prepilin-type N-terminal cleavage/methylation domain-containing protein n=1 Tax=Candidatus Niyogibacteria bacterium CG10_big_fil_rev_8_21_14_0_10_42_19 TaxID=1974725 RepID=A0A2H0TEQ6_9BACT|nr:MAG: hypothetical protein COU46_03585 [Candidatus Niyogibacteria bacterium CG10_big_fil_rev_8_21_14_0_10_42_19]
MADLIKNEVFSDMINKSKNKNFAGSCPWFFVRADEGKGFTLVEMIVAVGLFIVVVTLILTSVLGVIDFQRKAVAVQNAQNNLNFALEIASKEIRTGFNYYCGFSAFDIPAGGAIDIIPRSCSGGGAAITFTNYKLDKITYRFLSGRIERIVNDLQILVLTSNNVDIDPDISKFFVIGAEDIGVSQPRVTIVLKATSGYKDKTKEIFNLQTTISQLLINK